MKPSIHVYVAQFPLQVRFFDGVAALPFGRNSHANHRKQIARYPVPEKKFLLPNYKNMRWIKSLT